MVIRKKKRKNSKKKKQIVKIKKLKKSVLAIKAKNQEWSKKLTKRLKSHYTLIQGLMMIMAWAVITFLIVVIVIVLRNSFTILYTQQINFKIPLNRNNIPVCEFHHPLTGECTYWLENEESKINLDIDEELEEMNLIEIEDQKVFAVMVENHPEARPQSGLSSAQVVYEALVEGGITRFLLIYDNLQNLDSPIGPVRSARPYYLWFAYELDDALYGHVGGSPESLEYIQIKGLNDCDEFLYGGIFYERISQRRAPHNTYTSIGDLEGCNDGADMGRLIEIKPWAFMEAGEEKVISSPMVSEVKIAYSNYTYLATWQYNQEDRLYYRFYADGQPNLDKANNLQISTSNVIVLEMPSHVIDDYGRLSMDSIGEGHLIIYNKGEKIEGTWEKSSKEERIMFLDENADEIELAPGKIWIQVVPDLEIVEED